LRNKNNSSKFLVLSLLVVIALTFAIGCGGGTTTRASGGSNPGPTPTPTPTPVPPPGTPSLTATPTSLGFGSQAINTPITLTVAIKNTGTVAVNITKDTITGTGFTTGITVPINLNPAQSVNVPVVFTPTASGAVSGSLTLTSSGVSVVVPLSGTGMAPQPHSVDVSWTASTSGTLQGYNVNRSQTTGGPYNKISTTLSTTTLLFTDTTPVSGQHYFYVVTSVSTSGAESVSSTEAAVTIPTP